MTEYQDDALDIDDDTTGEEIAEYVEKRLENPIHIYDTTIYNFNNHRPDYTALEKAVEMKLEKDLYKIPLQLSGVNPFLVALLPMELKEADNLVYRKNLKRYYAYNSFFDKMSEDEIKDERVNLMGVFK